MIGLGASARGGAGRGNAAARADCGMKTPGGWGPVAQRSMRSKRTVEAPPAFHDDAGFGEGTEDLAIEKLVAEVGVEALDVSILPRAPQLVVVGLSADSGDPVLNRPSPELPLQRTRGRYPT